MPGSFPGAVQEAMAMASAEGGGRRKKGVDADWWGLGDCTVGPFRSAAQVAVAAVAILGVVCFTVGVVLEKPFACTVAALLVALCGYILWLQEERRKLRRRLDLLPKLGGAAAAAASDLDLSCYAESLGLNLASAEAKGASKTNDGGTLCQVLQGALAKEYLRTVAAIKQYQLRFGPLPAGAMAPPALTPTIGGPSLAAPGLLAPELPLGLLASEVHGPTTPRSPGGPPSPEQQRRQRSRDARSRSPGGPASPEQQRRQRSQDARSRSPGGSPPRSPPPRSPPPRSFASGEGDDESVSPQKLSVPAMQTAEPYRPRSFRTSATPMDPAEEAKAQPHSGMFARSCSEPSAAGAPAATPEVRQSYSGLFGRR